MLLLALKEAARYGWQLAASADVSAKYVHQENGPDYPADVHSWFFCYQGWSGLERSLSVKSCLAILYISKALFKSHNFFVENTISECFSPN